jgi:hypothetical protein
MRALMVCIAAVALGGCALHTHLDNGAPGVDDIHVPPANPEPGVTHPPADPGEDMLSLTTGGMAGGGGLFGSGDASGAGVLTAEVTLNWGTNHRSHYDDDFFVFTNSGDGINLGVTALFGDELHLPLYAEYQVFMSPVGGGAGWFYDPLTQASGPQLTVFTGCFYGRLEVALDGTTALHGGLLIKFPTWAWVSAR